MRLQLNVQRHALPATNILWTVRAQDPLSTSAHASATVSQLLEDVNDIVQLESEGWGLEDYVVEVGGYECLHFQPINSVLKEDDRVTIRALQTSDLRIRRIGGRHQIAADGRHLFDGVAFGRPYLRKSARPAFRIPPRKRRKLDVGHGQYIEDDSVVQTLLQESENYAETALDVGETEANPSSTYDNHLQIVARQHFEDADQVSIDEEDDSSSDSDLESFNEEEGDEENLDLSEELKALLEDNPLEPRDDDDDGDNDQSSHAESEMKKFDAVRQHKKRKRDSEGAPEDESASSTGGSKFPTELVRVVSPKQLITSSASNSGPSSELVNATNSNAQRLSPFEGFSEEVPSSDTASSEVTSSESESEAGSKKVSSSLSGSLSSSTSSSSDSDSESISGLESGSESGPESDTGSVPAAEDEDAATAGSLSSVRKKLGEAVKEESIVLAAAVSIQSAPGEGSKQTHQNNQRKKRRRKLDLLKAEGLVGPNAGFKELSIFEQAESKASMSHDLGEPGGLNNVFEARKQELLQQVMPPEVDSESRASRCGNNTEGASPTLPEQYNGLPAQSSAVSGEDNHQNFPSMRAKLDIASSRRMVFGSLGLKNPKTAAAEQELRGKFVNQGRQSADGRPNGTISPRADSTETTAKHVSALAQSEVWKQKIILSAVECEDGGQVLSTPPFPFVQRWQQGKRKSGMRDSADMHDDPGAETFQDTSAAPDELDSSGLYAEGDSILAGVRLNGAIQNQLIQEAQELSQRRDAKSSVAPDLPLITDFDALESLRVQDAVAGAVIAFRHLEMSKETNWQPEWSAYRTAKVQEVLQDGTLQILLAEKDRTPIPISFDNQTGERIFDKFEMPFEEEEEEVGNGVREVSYGDLIEPKLVERTLHPSVTQPAQPADESTGLSKSDEEVPQVKDSTKSTEHSAEVPSAQVEVPTPRQKEISKLIKDAGFHSSLDAELLQSTPQSTGVPMSGEDNSSASPETVEKHSDSRSMNLDGAAMEAGAAGLDSPLFAGGDSSSFHQDDDFYDSSSNFGQGRTSPAILENQEDGDPNVKKSVDYPRISQLVLDEDRTPTMSGKEQSAKILSTNSTENGKRIHDSDVFNKDNDTIFEPEESYFDSLKTAIPSSDAAAPKPVSGPSTPGSLFTNPCLSDLNNNGSSSDDLPSLSEITSTARSGKVSPPPLKKSSNTKRRSSASPDAPSSSMQEPASTEVRTTQTQTSSSFQPSQIPPGSPLVDLTLSSDPISLEHSDGDGEYDGPTRQRSSVRIKQSSSQVVKARETLSSGAKIGNRRLARGRFGRPKSTL